MGTAGVELYSILPENGTTERRWLGQHYKRDDVGRQDAGQKHVAKLPATENYKNGTAKRCWLGQHHKRDDVGREDAGQENVAKLPVKEKL